MTSPHVHIFVCHRQPYRHSFVTACTERLVICPECYGAGQTVRIQIGVYGGTAND